MVAEATPDVARDLRRFLTRADGAGRPDVAPRDLPPPEWPAPLDRAALYGLAGEIVSALLPETEADEAGLLFTLHAAVGNAVGPDAYWEVSGRRHGLRVWPLLVGPTALGRKGTSWGTIRPVLQRAAPDWLGACVNGGLSSGEGLIFAVRDPLTKGSGADEEVIDPGVADKRLFLVEEEFSGTLKIANRDGNSLSAIVRKAYDGETLASLTKATPIRASSPHVTVVGHTTAEELHDHVSDTQVAGGLLNRFTLVGVRRSKLLPDAGPLDPAVVERLGADLAARLAAATGCGLLVRDAEASELWRTLYGPLSDGEPGLLGAVTSRAEVQVMRMAGIYAVLDGGSPIRSDHLRAAVACWDYALASARFVFGDRLGDPIADAILHALAAGDLTQTEVSGLFDRNVSAAKLRRALGSLVAARRIERHQTPAEATGGRPATVWRRVPR